MSSPHPTTTPTVSPVPPTAHPVLPQPSDVTPPAAFVDGGATSAADHGNAEHGGAHRVDLPPMSTGVVLGLGAGFVALLAGLFFVGYVPHHRRAAEIAERAHHQLSDKPIVNVTQVKHAEGAPAIELPGAARAFQSTAIFPRASGYLAKQNVDIGDVVKAGDVLAVIETPELDAQLTAARATLEQGKANLAKANTDLELAQTTLKRYQGFAQGGGVTQQQLDEKTTAFEQTKSAQAGAEATVKNQQAEVQRLEALAGFKTIYAPFAGKVTSRGYDLGALLSASGSSGRPLFQLDQLDTIRVFVDVPQAYSQQIRVGNKAQFLVRADPGHPFEGAIARTSGAIDETTRTLRVEADFPNADGRLLPGMYGTVRYEVGKAGQATPLVVPTGALVYNSKGTQVVVVGEDNKAQFRPVTVGRDYGTEIEVAKGLDGSERVIADPGERIADGVEVEVAKPAAGDAKPAVAAGGNNAGAAANGQPQSGEQQQQRNSPQANGTSAAAAQQQSDALTATPKQDPSAAAPAPPTQPGSGAPTNREAAAR